MVSGVGALRFGLANQAAGGARGATLANRAPASGAASAISPACASAMSIPCSSAAFLIRALIIFSCLASYLAAFLGILMYAQAARTWSGLSMGYRLVPSRKPVSAYFTS